MDKLVKHAIRMLEIVDGENDFFRNDAKRQADIARAVYDTILRVQILERKFDNDINVRSKAIYDKWGNVFDTRADIDDEPQTDKDFKVTYTCSFTDCDNFKNFGFGEKCIECKRKQSKAKYRDEPQTKCETCRYTGECDQESWQDCPYTPKDKP